MSTSRSRRPDITARATDAAPDQVVGSVAALWRYPIKSMQGERLHVAELDERGVIGDRGWATVTPDGSLGSGKSTRRFARVDGLMDLHARTRDGDVTVIGTDGLERDAGEDDTDAWLSSELGQPLVIRRENATPHHDDGAIHLVTTSSLAWLASRLGRAQVDERRFRPNVVVDTGAEPGTPEQGWIGRRLRLGEVVLEVTHATERCRMVTMEQPLGVDADPNVLATIVRELDEELGVYARVVQPGEIRLNAEVTLEA